MPLGLFLFFRGHLSQTPDFRLAKQIFVPNFRYTTWARILSDRSISCTLSGGRTTAGSNASRAFLVLTPPSGRGLVIPIFLFTSPSGRFLVKPIFLSEVFLFGSHLPQTSARPKKYLPVIFVRLAFISQNFHKSWRRKSLAIEWHKNSFDES